MEKDYLQNDISTNSLKGCCVKDPNLSWASSSLDKENIDLSIVQSTMLFRSTF